MLVGAADSCRSEIVIGETSAIGDDMDGDTLVGALIRDDFYKILLGPPNQDFLVGQDVITGPIWPNATVAVPILKPKHCGRTPTKYGRLPLQRAGRSLRKHQHRSIKSGPL